MAKLKSAWTMHLASVRNPVLRSHRCHGHNARRGRANPRELMARMGHDSARAALIYLHSSAERQRALASEIGKNARAALGKPESRPKRSGTRKARNGEKAS